jgi:hypothetical protein
VGPGIRKKMGWIFWGGLEGEILGQQERRAGLTRIFKAGYEKKII